uniref:Hexosyltransferase n=1 Tax=Seriola lalandi dorsalis TaxID=1841481 RepID=A0A3B4YM93_SERLL
LACLSLSLCVLFCPCLSGEFVFSLSSNDNSELWLSTDESPLNLQLLAWVGKTGTEWTAPGEFVKYASQTSRPVRLSAERRYFFEVIHKQDNKGTDHVEVAWQLLDQSFRFMVIESKHISLYVNESALLMSDVAHIPQTAASHQHIPTKQHDSAEDIMREDPRDSLYKVPLINSKFLQGILPDCSYKPSYTIKDFPLLRYQGLQFVHMSYIYPNDYTRLTNMESENSCFYPKSPYYMKINVSQPEKPDELLSELTQLSRRHLQTNQTELKLGGSVKKVEQIKPKRKRPIKRQKVKSVKKTVTPRQTNPLIPEGKEVLKAKEQPALPVEQLNYKQHQIQRSHKMNQTQIQRINHSKHQPLERNAPLAEKPTEDQVGKEDKVRKIAENRRDTREGGKDYLWGPGNFEVADDEALTPVPVFDTEVNWSQTFQVNHLDLQARRSDSIDLHCNVSGNLLLDSSDVLPIVKFVFGALCPCRRFTLERVVNVVKRVDGVQGSRYLLELQLKDVNGQLLRLSQYIYTLIRHSRQRSRDFSFKQPKSEPVLCNPVGLRWNPVATVHFVVPVKNQARWVQQLIADMEKLFRETGDTNFNLIIADYNSTDMDVRMALQKSSLPRYQYVKLSGNFERSAGLQAGINLINDNHSIVFLCDLHIHFPPFIIDTIRKHCVEGYMVFAPIVMRLNCGATPSEARGYWEVNGFGLLGIYKSDLDAVGGMNTKDFTDRWGGEDWELLDRVLQAGLEVERIYLRNFFHHYHSKRGMWNRRMSHSHR